MAKITQRIIKHFKQYKTKTAFHTDNKFGIFLQPERTKAQSYCVVEEYISTLITAITSYMTLISHPSQRTLPRHDIGDSHGTIEGTLLDNSRKIKYSNEMGKIFLLENHKTKFTLQW